MRKRNHLRKIRFSFLPAFLLVILLAILLPLRVIIGNPNNLESDEYVKFIKSQTGEFDYNAKKAIFNNREVPLPPPDLAYGESKILGQQAPPNDNRWIEINLSQQRLYLHDGGNIVGNFLVSTGLWAPTPTGTYRIYVKYRYTTMSGGSGAGYYYLPNVPFTMYFYKGYGIHGTYWHNNFGHPMSHGCVNMRTSEAEIAYNFATVGTKVVIHY